jgi:glutamine cyclotransferase
LLVLVLAGGCAAGGKPAPAATTAVTLRAEVLAKLPHDANAFTEGFELVDGVLYEGTGLEGASSLRATDPATGEVRQRTDLPGPLFGEGITVVGDRIWQLTWRDGIALQRDRATFAEVRRVTYSGEGWGLCHDGSRLVMSDGSDTLTFRDPSSFTETGRVKVTRDGQPLEKINELECVGGSVWANVWQSDDVVRIDPVTGKVTGVAGLGSLRPAENSAADVLNGIAAVPGTDEFLVTGKNWTTTYRVRFTAG